VFSNSEKGDLNCDSFFSEGLVTELLSVALHICIDNGMLFTSLPCDGSEKAPSTG
jgi:hypothetical protein